jgi:hypothetical protein
MPKQRLEAFSDGDIAILSTIGPAGLSLDLARRGLGLLAV